MRQRAAWWRGERGEWYVVIQAGLLLLLIFGPQTLHGLPAWPHLLRVAARVTGGFLLFGGALLVFLGFVSLGRNLTPFPRPKADSRLVDTGPYRLVRHPIYGGIILMAYGWALVVQGLLTLVYATLIFIWLDLKSRREERWLNEKFHGYAAYSKKVRKLIPFIY